MPTNVAVKLNAQNLFARDNYENGAGKKEISLTYFAIPLTIHTNCFTSICILSIIAGYFVLDSNVSHFPIQSPRQTDKEVC